MSIETMTKLATVTVGAGGSSTISFTNIPQTYTDLKILVSGRNTTNTLDCTITFNSSSTGYSRRNLYGNGSSTVTTSASDQYVIWLSQNSDTSSTFGNAEIYIPNYTSNNYKAFYSDSVTENNATLAYQFLHAALWSNTSAITSITLTSGSNFAQHSTFTLYGIMNARRTAGNSIKATGGVISFDGTYVVHTFNTSGTFTPTVAIPRADYLVVAGGGGGGSNIGSGGGAGGLKTSIGGTGLALTAQPYAVTVGAGGAAGNAGTSNGVSGSSSVLGSISTTGGGNGVLYDGGVGRTGGNGGSGGGGGSGFGSGGTAGTGIVGEGNNGGAGQIGGPPYRAGSGGGAGAAGTTGGNGGAGVSNSITGLSITYAGGGGSGTYNNCLATLGGSGGGGNGNQTNDGPGFNATPNTGGGGGGGGLPNVFGGNGGSGVVIIRYKA